MSGRIRGYTDRPNALPGESITVHVSADPDEYSAELVRLIHVDPSPEGPGTKIVAVPGVLDRRYEGRRQRTQVGSYVEVESDPQLVPGGGLSLHAFVQPTRQVAGRQAIISCWADDEQAGWGLFVEDGCLTVVIGDGAGGIARVVSRRPLFAGVWYAVAAVHDPTAHSLHLAQRTVIGRANSLLGPVVPLDSSWEGGGRAEVELSSPRVPLIIGGAAEATGGERTWVTACFDGKIDAPRLYDRALQREELDGLSEGEEGPADGLVARWDFAAGITDQGIGSDVAVDLSGSGHHGRCVNQPDRAATGWNWSGRRDVFTQAPEEYGALGFHSDALDDCRWDADFGFEIPVDLRSGCYAVHVAQGDQDDYIPFFVRPAAGSSPAPIALLMPTLTYVIYGNFHNIYRWEGWGFDPYEAANGVIPLDWRDLEMLENPDDYGLALYDNHVDGRGVQYASWRRPILNARPGQTFSFNFQADFYLIDWLESQGFAYDVITDHDLHEHGIELLSPYRVLVTGSHPEYYTWEMRDAIEDYLSAGGRGMYLGANGFYWVTAIHPDKPWLAEVRRGDTGDTPWHGPPGEYHHSFTGERGGLWRHRGRPPQKVCGTGYASHSFGISGYYVRLPDSYDDRVAWMFDGIGGIGEETIGDFGLVGGGAAGMELDVYDRALGTPPHALLLGSSVEHDQVAMLVPEELFNSHPVTVGNEHPKIRADIVYFTTRDGGAVFSTSSIAWAGSLSANEYSNSVSRLTGNVLRRFASSDPLPPVLGTPA